MISKSIVIVGPTASGKTDLSLKLAKRLGSSIINTDSRLFYKNLDVGTGKPSKIQRDEIKHHIRQVFRQGHRDIILTGSITQGNAEYFEQYGIHLQVAKRYIEEYINASEKAIDEGQLPNVNHLYAFLDRMVENFKDAHQDVVNHIGLDKLLRGEFLYREDRHGKEGASE